MGTARPEGKHWRAEIAVAYKTFMPKQHAAKPNAQLSARREKTHTHTHTHKHTLNCWQRQSGYQPWSLGYRACGIALIVGNHFTSWKNWLWVSTCMRPSALLSHLVCAWLYFQVSFEGDTLCPHASACVYFEALRNRADCGRMYSIFCHKIRKENSYLNDAVSEQWMIHFFCMTQKDLMFSGRISFALLLHF